MVSLPKQQALFFLADFFSIARNTVLVVRHALPILIENGGSARQPWNYSDVAYVNVFCSWLNGFILFYLERIGSDEMQDFVCNREAVAFLFFIRHPFFPQFI